MQENREREEAEKRHKRKESLRVAAKHRPAASGANGDSASLESALHSFLSTVPEGLARCRRNALPSSEGSPSKSTEPSAEKMEKRPHSNQGSPEKKPFKVQEEDELMGKPAHKESEVVDGVSLNVLCYQKGSKDLEGDRVSGTPCHLQIERDSVGTPRTPRPRTRDYFFASNGEVSSPWTILSPFTCTQRNTPQRPRPAHQRRLSSTYGGNNLGVGVWKNDEANDTPKSISQTSGSLLKCPIQRALSQGAIHRSLSVDETAQSPASGSRVGDLSQRSGSQRSYSSSSTENTRKEGTLIPNKGGNNAEGQVSTSGFISFFRRIGGRSKPGDLEEQSFKGSST